MDVWNKSLSPVKKIAIGFGTIIITTGLCFGIYSEVTEDTGNTEYNQRTGPTPSPMETWRYQQEVIEHCVTEMVRGGDLSVDEGADAIVASRQLTDPTDRVRVDFALECIDYGFLP